MKVAVTGATGHVGANLCRQLLEHGAAVRALHRARTTAIDGLEIETAEGDVLEADSLRRAFRGVDAVIHLAARISIEGDPGGVVSRTNVEGPRNVVRACLAEGVGRLVHMSSFHAFHQDRERPLTEEVPQVGSEGYAYDRSKAAGEREIDEGVARGLHAVILNPTGIIGPFDFGPSLAGKGLLDMYRGRMPALVPGGTDWVDARDVSAAAIAALECGNAGDRHLLSGGWASLRDLASHIAEISGRPPPRWTVPEPALRAGVPAMKFWSRMAGASPLFTRQSLDALTRSSRDVRHDRATERLGFSPRPLSDTLADTLDWFRSVGWLDD